MNNKRVAKVFLVVLLGCIMLGGIAGGLAFWKIRQSVITNCVAAHKAYPHSGDDIDALIFYIYSDQHTFKERNRAVWTFGRLKDDRALPALNHFYTGAPCKHDSFLCQYELQKAIKRCGGAPDPIWKEAHNQNGE